MPPTAPKIALSGACERDLDLLLMEEFSATPAFLAWFLSLVELPIALDLLEVAHSVSTSNGESDLELTYTSSAGRHKILVENKVDAQFQPKQAERYRERAETYLKAGACDVVTTVLLAPAAYIDSSEVNCGFDRHFPLETLLSWFRESPDLDARRNFKCTLLSRTIERSAAGWTLVPHAACTAFWHDYWELADRLAPELEMPEPGEKPAGSSFIYFRPAGLSKDVAVVHKVAYGNVDLQFAGLGDKIAALKAKYRDVLQPEMTIDRANKSAVVRIKVPGVDLGRPLSENRAAVEQGLTAATRLLRWYRSHT